MKRKVINIISILLITLSWLLSGTGCVKNFLEKPAGSTVTADTIFGTYNQARLAVAQMYAKCIYDYWFGNNENWEAGQPCEALTDCIDLPDRGGYWQHSNINVADYTQGTMQVPGESGDGNGPDFGGGYGEHYAAIRIANLVLANIGKVKDAPAGWIDDVKGQAIFLRAWQHFELFRFYGGIPIINHPLSGIDSFYPRRSVKSVIDSIVTWCDRSYNLLPPTRPTSEYGMVTKIAALSLKSRALLFAASPQYNTPPSMTGQLTGMRYGDARDSVLGYAEYDVNRWKLAADAAKAVIDNAAASNVSLYYTGKAKTPIGPPTYGQNYSDLGDYEAMWNVFGNQEMILTSNTKIAQSWMVTDLMWGDMLDWPNSWYAKTVTPIEFAQKYEKSDGTTWTFPATGNDLPTFLEGLNLDPRFYATLVYDGKWYTSAQGQLSYYLQGNAPQAGTLNKGNGLAMETYKFSRRVDNLEINHMSYPIMRLAEFYLNYSEALNEFSGPSADTYTYLNLIRQRAGMPPKSGLDQSGFRDAVQNERTIELAFENSRLSDLLRWMQADVVLNQTLHAVRTTGNVVGGVLYRNWDIKETNQRIFPKKYYYLPFAQNQISDNYLGGGKGWYGQNPGW